MLGILQIVAEVDPKTSQVKGSGGGDDMILKVYISHMTLGKY